MRALTDFPDAHLRIFDRPAPPERDALKTVHLIGVCGTGMGSLAGLLQQAGYAVRGSDQAAYPPMSTRLEEMGVRVIEGYDAKNLDPAPDLVVVGNACTPTHPEATFAREQGLAQLSLPEALSHFFIEGHRSLVVAGTHGKTSTTGLLVHVFSHAGLDPSYLVGGVMSGVNRSYAVGGGRHFIVEGDEYDSAYFDKRPKFMHYQPSAAIITSLEFDHADIYDDWDDYREAFRAFAATVPSGGVLALFGDDPEVRALADYAEADVRFYGTEGEDDHVTARDVCRVDGGQRFVLEVMGQRLGVCFLPLSGRHNLRNALAVATIALHEGITPDQLRDAFASFRGMKRRQEVLGEADGVVVVDDFAHHPTAVRETIRAVGERWPNRRLAAVFEPRSNSSRRKVFEAEYQSAFSQADLVFLSSPPFRDNDDASRFMDSAAVVEGIRQSGTEAHLGQSADDLLPLLTESLRPGDVVLIMSNGGFGGIHRKLLAALEARA
jgi:UDP-N-acetylmuramate: L-alanyl-gamma-D-glutamyl-meso-diaminopimelate ligase